MINRIIHCLVKLTDKNTQESQDKIDKKDEYQALINARNVNYDSFNKWATYFSTIIGAIFVGYYTIKSSSDAGKFNLEIRLLSLLGYIISFLWFLSCKGFHHWNRLYIDKLSKFPNSAYGNFEYDTKECIFAPHRGINISTPRISIWLSFIISIIWGTIFFNNMNIITCINNILTYFKLNYDIPIIPNIVISSVITYGLNLSFNYFLKKNKLKTFLNQMITDIKRKITNIK